MLIYDQVRQRCKNEKLLTKQEKSDFFFIDKMWNFPLFLEILTDIRLICLHIIKSNDLEIMFMLQGFLFFALHCMRNTQVRETIEVIIH